MELERVIDVLAKEKPDKILIYIRDKSQSFYYGYL